MSIFRSTRFVNYNRLTDFNANLLSSRISRVVETKIKFVYYNAAVITLFNANFNFSFINFSFHNISLILVEFALAGYGAIFEIGLL